MVKEELEQIILDSGNHQRIYEWFVSKPFVLKTVKSR